MTTAWRGPRSFPRRRCVCGFSGEGQGRGTSSPASHRDAGQGEPGTEGTGPQAPLSPFPVGINVLLPGFLEGAHVLLPKTCPVAPVLPAQSS